MPLHKNEVVLVIGGAGFLGQHIIKHLLNDSRVKEIRVFDTKCYTDDQIEMGKSFLSIY
jgi:nucleoside-diphosphate-sugar epimerase